MFFRKRRTHAEGNAILLSDLIVHMPIGVFDHEKGRTQRVRINIRAIPLHWPDEAQDNIEDTVSYDELKKLVERQTASGHVHLVETLAERIAQDALKEHPLRQITVRVEKLDIYDNAVPGVEIIRVK